MKYLKTSLMTAALALAVQSPVEATLIRLDLSGQITSENDPANIVSSGVLGVNSPFSVSFIYDTDSPALGGIPGLSEGYSGNNWVLNFGGISGTANTGSLSFNNDLPVDRAFFGFNYSDPGVVTAWSGLDAGTDFRSVGSVFSSPTDIWNTTDINQILGADLLALTSSRTQTFRVGDAFGNVAVFDGTIASYSMTDVTPVPEPGSTGVLMGGAVLALVATERLRRRREWQATE